MAFAPGAEARVYWANTFGDSIGRANLDAGGIDQEFITGAFRPRGVAVDSKYVYWGNDDIAGGTIGRANLDGAKGAKKGKLSSTGRVRVKAKVVYGPSGGGKDTAAKRIRLVRR